MLVVLCPPTKITSKSFNPLIYIRKSLIIILKQEGLTVGQHSSRIIRGQSWYRVLNEHRIKVGGFAKRVGFVRRIFKQNNGKSFVIFQTASVICGMTVREPVKGNDCGRSWINKGGFYLFFVFIEGKSIIGWVNMGSFPLKTMRLVWIT